MELSKRQQSASEIQCVSISVSFAWEKKEDVVVGPLSDTRWKQLRGLIKKVQAEVDGRLKKTHPNTVLPQRLNRLRARHGGFILESLKERLRRTDIYVADISNYARDGFNPNVMLEVGMAIAMGIGAAGNMFLLIPEKFQTPSDLNGLLLTKYRLEDDEISIVDKQGFRAALMSSIYSVAHAKGLITALDESDDDIDNDVPTGASVA